MKIIDGTWSLVTVGKWNKYILNPNWVGKNIFNEEKIRVEFPVNNPDMPPRYISSDNIMFVPANHRISFIAQDPYNDEMLKKICNMNRKIIEILSHTPITAIGSNFGFEEKSEIFSQLELFKFFDSDLLTDNGYLPKISEIKRQFQLDSGLLNLTIKYDEETVTFDCNFHYKVSGAEDAIPILQEDLILKNKEISFHILKNLYKLEIDEEEE